MGTSSSSSTVSSGTSSSSSTASSSSSSVSISSSSSSTISSSSTSTNSDKKVCPYVECPFQDAPHLRDYVHKKICQFGASCQLISDNSHTDIWFHTCPRGLQCELKGDTNHARNWTHQDNKNQVSTPVPIVQVQVPIVQVQVPLQSSIEDDETLEGHPNPGTTDNPTYTAAEAKTWSADHVLDWLTRMELTEGGIKDAFLRAKIKGNRLLELDEQDLEDIGIKERYHRRSVISQIKVLKDGK